MRRNFSNLTLKDAMELVPAQDLTRWALDVTPRPPSDILLANLNRLESFALTTSEAAKVLLIDTVLAEIVPVYPKLKVWKGEPLESNSVGGVADYLIAPRRAYVETLLLCAIEAKRDDFDAGQVQCIAEMAACRENNRRDGYDIEIHGIVSNGQGWVFYRLTRTPEVYVSGLFTMNDLPTLLGALDYVCAACVANMPQIGNPSIRKRLPSCGAGEDCPVDAVESLRRVIAAVFAEWEKLPRMPSDWNIQGVCDENCDRYTLQMVDFGGDRYKSSLLAHLEIRDGKIWILTDNTDEGIGNGLLEQGVSKQQIVLAFYPPSVRAMGEFSVA